MSDCRRSASFTITCVNSRSSGVGQLALEKLRRAADAAQRVLDLVREVADELAVGLLLLEDASPRARSSAAARARGIPAARRASPVSAGADRRNAGARTRRSTSSSEVVVVEARLAFRARARRPLHECLVARQRLSKGTPSRCLRPCAKQASRRRDWRRSRAGSSSSMSTAVDSSSSPAYGVTSRARREKQQARQPRRLARRRNGDAGRGDCSRLGLRARRALS